MRIVHRQHPQEHLVHEREDRGIGADAERDRTDRDSGEARHLAPGAKCESGLGEQAVHGGWTEVGLKALGRPGTARMRASDIA